MLRTPHGRIQMSETTRFICSPQTNYTHRICNLAEIDSYYRMKTKYFLSNICLLKHLTVQSGIHEEYNKVKSEIRLPCNYVFSVV